MFARSRVFVVGTILFSAASSASRPAQNSGMVDGPRFAQGLGEALASPAALSLVALLFNDPKERAQAIGGFGGVTILGATLGAVISGFIVDQLSWRWIFLVNLPVAAFVIFVLPRMVKESRMPGKQRINIVGALLVTGGLTLVVAGLLNSSNHGWGRGAVVGPLAGGVVLRSGFAITGFTVPQPLIPLRFFKDRT